METQLELETVLAYRNKVLFIRVNLELLNLALNIHVVLQSSSIKIGGKSVKRFLSYDRV